MRLAVATLVALFAFVSPALASSVSNVTLTNSAPSNAAGARTVYVAGFTTSATGALSNAANSRINVAFPTGTTFTGYTNGVVRNLTASQDIGTCGNPTGLTIQCSLSFGASIGAGHDVRVTFNGITNPSTPGTDKTITVSTTADVDPVVSPAFPVVAAAPVTDVTLVNAAPSDGAGARTQYVAEFSTPAGGGVSNAANSRIEVTFPAGTTFAGYTNAVVRTVTDVGTCGNPTGLVIQCSLSFGATIGASQNVRITFNGITNPGTPGTDKTVAVSTTSSPASVNSSPFTVAPAGTLGSVTADNSSPSTAAGARTRYVVGLTASSTGGLSNAANSRISVTFPTGTTFAGYTNAVVRNLSTATDVGTCGNPVGLVIECSLTFNATIGAGHSVGITFNGITNTSTAGTDKRMTVSTTSDTPPVDSNQFAVAAAGTISSVTGDNASPSRAAGARTRYVIGYTASSTGGLSNAANSRIDVAFPAGTTFAGYTNAVVRNLSTATDVGTCGNAVGLVIQCSLSFNATIGAGHSVGITFNGITNPTLVGTDKRVTVATTSDPAPVNSGTFSVVAANPITAVSVANATPSAAAGARTQYLVEYTASTTGALANAANSRINVIFPAGTTFTGYTNAVVRDVTAEDDVGTCGSAVGTTIQCSLSFGAAIAAGNRVRITFNGITNATPDTDNTVAVFTTSDPAVVGSSPFTILAGQSLSSVTATPANPAAGATTPYTVAFRASSTGGLSNAANSRIEVTFPAGTTFAGYNSAVVRDETAGQNVGSCGSPNGRVIQCSLSFNAAIAAGHNARITFNTITNPATTGSYAVTVSTTSDLPPVGSSAYEVGNDTTAPETTIGSDGASFTFSSDEPGVTFECSIDGGSYAPCSSPFAPPALAPGEHTLSVRAIDGAGNADGTPAIRGFVVEQPPPQPTAMPTPTVTPAPGPTPQFNQTVVVEPAGGTVEVCPKGGKCFTLAAGQQIPLGSTVNTKKGAVELTSVSAPGAPKQTAVFSEGIFRVSQRGDITELKLTEPLAPCSKRARAAAKKPKSRKLWGKGTGRFRTVGNYSAATVRGTRWLTQDTCAGTLTRVTEGAVSVRDNVKKKTVLVRPGKPYTAKPRR